MALETQILPSKGEAKKIISANGIAINLEKYVDVNGMLNDDNLINEKYIVVKKGKKEFSLIVAE